MVIRTFFNKNNTIVKNDIINTAKNPVTELFYGGSDSENKYSRYLFNFDENRLRTLYTDKVFTDLSKLKHTLKLTNTSTFDKGLLNGTYQSKERTTSFDLIAFKINQNWDEGVGYDFATCGILIGDKAYSTKPSTWVNPRTGEFWLNGAGIYSGSPSNITIATQHFDNGNENIEMDITAHINAIITGQTNYGIGIAYAYPYELTSTPCLQYVGFFTRNTQTFFEPYIETIYNNTIIDDRNNFYADKQNKLYLYVNLGGVPTNLDTNPSVRILNENDEQYMTFIPSEVEHVTKGVYAINITIDSTILTYGTLFKDVWGDIIINGIQRPDVTLTFEPKDSMGYYNINDNDLLPKNFAISISGIKNQEKIKRGDIRKVIVSTRIPYTVEQTQYCSNLKYRLYIIEGKNEITVTDYQSINITANHNYFLLDTQSLIPNTYYIDIIVESNQELTTHKDVVNFTITSQSNDRQGQ